MPEQRSGCESLVGCHGVQGILEVMLADLLGVTLVAPTQLAKLKNDPRVSSKVRMSINRWHMFWAAEPATDGLKRAPDSTTSSRTTVFTRS